MISDDTAKASAPLYKYVSLDVLRRILAGSIRFTQPSAFNDSFELLPEIVMPIGEPNRRINIKFDILAERRHPRVGEIDTVPAGNVSGDPTSRNIVDQLNAIIGFFCLSRKDDSLLMWAHYAQQYSGAVVEFDPSHEVFANPIDIEYRALRPKRHLSVYTGDEPIPLSELCVKSCQWEYEKEVRIVRCLAEC